MSKSQIFRGPDSQDFYNNVQNNLCFGINRLAVIDRELGKQQCIHGIKNL